MEKMLQHLVMLTDKTDLDITSTAGAARLLNEVEGFTEDSCELQAACDNTWPHLPCRPIQRHTQK